jgi:hypothetical protein
MPTLLETVLSADDLFDPEVVIAQHPWLVEEGLSCVISPDADGQLCGLFLSNLLKWHVRGFYDGKALVVDHRVDPNECVFVDVEIFRRGVRSFGNHMLLFNANRKPDDWDNRFENCFAINNWRDHDRRVFNRKYPFASIHFMLVVLAARHEIALPGSATGPLLFADGVYKLLLQYTENAWDWMRYLGVKNEKNPLHALFHNPDLSVYEVMTKMLDFWKRRDELSITGHRGDRIAITERGGEGRVVNLVADSNGEQPTWGYEDGARLRSEEFLEMLGKLTTWKYLPEQWSWNHWRLFEFEKGINSAMTNLKAFNSVIDLAPLSWAITAAERCEYTLDRNSVFG